MEFAPVIIGLLSALVGALVPLLKEIAKDLRTKSKGESFVKSRTGQAIWSTSFTPTH